MKDDGHHMLVNMARQYLVDAQYINQAHLLGTLPPYHSINTIGYGLENLRIIESAPPIIFSSTANETRPSFDGEQIKRLRDFFQVDDEGLNSIEGWILVEANEILDEFHENEYYAAWDSGMSNDSRARFNFNRVNVIVPGALGMQDNLYVALSGKGLGKYPLVTDGGNYTFETTTMGDMMVNGQMKKDYRQLIRQRTWRRIGPNEGVTDTSNTRMLTIMKLNPTGKVNPLTGFVIFNDRKKTKCVIVESEALEKGKYRRAENMFDVNGFSAYSIKQRDDVLIEEINPFIDASTEETKESIAAVLKECIQLQYAAAEPTARKNFHGFGQKMLMLGFLYYTAYSPGQGFSLGSAFDQKYSAKDKKGDPTGPYVDYDPVPQLLDLYGGVFDFKYLSDLTHNSLQEEKSKRIHTTDIEPTTFPGILDTIKTNFAGPFISKFKLGGIIDNYGEHTMYRTPITKENFAKITQRSKEYFERKRVT